MSFCAGVLPASLPFRCLTTLKSMATQLPHLPEVERMSSLVIRVLGGNPGKFTLQGTNTYLVGRGHSRLLLDTGEESITISHAIITHWHPDHVGGLADLLSLCPEVKVYKYDPSTGQNPIDDCQIFETDGAKLRAFHCPGHTADHMAFILEEENAMFTGDNVLGHGTTVFEDLAVYLNSLSRMREQFRGRAYPAHGAVIEDGRARIEEYITHRKQREEEILQALKGINKEVTSMELVKVVYQDVSESLHVPAANGALQVLRKLEAEGKVAYRQQGRWQIAS